MRWTELLESIRQEIQAEHSLISHRLSWYVSSQSFLVTAYVVAWQTAQRRQGFFLSWLPILGGTLSILALVRIGCAIYVQRELIDTQAELMDKLLEGFKSNPAQYARNARAIIPHYKKITCAGRHGKAITHYLAMLPQGSIPILFLVFWTTAFLVAPGWLGIILAS